MKNIPKEIYLNLGIPKREMNIDKSDAISFDDLNDITWSKDKIDDQDLKFVLSDVYVSQQRELLIDFSNAMYKISGGRILTTDEFVDKYIKDNKSTKNY